ncbi:MAG: 23S rRNA (pseudouridine(1915)-N(3))-methyltransferase RlmH [Lachnospiraceae bacterium]|nr:23S rRNA (pseudouridine(1915)-N(3))-methyltransferase RlmH [Lachnospiraceae bacterium]
MKISIVCVGKIKESFYREAIAEYAKRLSRYCKLEIFEVSDEKTPDKAPEAEENRILEKEASRIEPVLKDDSYKIILDIGGKTFDSVAFSEKIESLAIGGISHITFIIGGSLGLSEQIKKIGDLKISFSDMTFPHQLMRVILLEQIYRAYRIMNHEPYHK